jgi:hypothetical protein
MRWSDLSIPTCDHCGSALVIREPGISADGQWSKRGTFGESKAGSVACEAYEECDRVGMIRGHIVDGEFIRNSTWTETSIE